MDFSEAYADTCSTIGAAARVGDVCALQTLLTQGRPVDVRDNRGWEPLHEAAFWNNTGCLQVLLHRGKVDVNVQSFAGETPLLLAARKGNLQCVSALLHCGGDPNLSTPEGLSPLWEAVTARSFACVRLLVEKGSNIEKKNYTQATCLHQAVDTNDLRIVNFLMASGANIDVADENLLTPLFMAAQRGNYECLKLLLDKSHEEGKSHLVDASAFDNATPLLVASQQGHTACVELLISHHASPNIFTSDPEPVCPLQSAIVCNNLDCVKLLYPVTKIEEIHKKCFCEWHPLPLSLDLSHVAILEFLLLDNVSTDVTVTYHLTSSRVYPRTLPLLTYAVLECSDLKCIDILLQYGFPVNDSRGHLMPPLIAAFEMMRVDCIHLFWKYGAKPNIYHPNIVGNFTVLYAIHDDLISQNIHSCTFDGTFLQTLLKHKVDVKSCLVYHSPLSPDGLTMQSLVSLLTYHRLHFMHFDIILNLLIFKSGALVNLCESFAEHLEITEWQSVKQTCKTCNTLLHLSRLKLIDVLKEQNSYSREFVHSLALPSSVEDVLLLEDTGKLQGYLTNIFQLK
ncbi:ankyrin repeat and SOCS box protein 3-like [Argonauta hians]